MTHPGGRPRKIESPEMLWDMFEEYRGWASKHPWKKQDFIRSGPNAGEKVHLETERPLTEWEFAVHIGMSRSGLIEYCSRPEFSDIYHRIKDVMSSQRISGGLANAYNGNLVARIDGISDRQEIEQTTIVSDTLSAARKRAHQTVDKQPT